MENQAIIVVDYGLGNVRSIVNAFSFIGAQCLLCSDPRLIRGARGVVLPGVGSFNEGMRNLKVRRLVDPLLEYAAGGGMMLGICLGMQLLFQEGHEFGRTPGLGLIGGSVVALPIRPEQNLRRIHVTWNSIRQCRPHAWDGTILCDVPDGSDVYFVHSYIGVPEAPNTVLAATLYGDLEFCSAVRYRNVFGTQFHPEKSGRTGLSILRAFCRLAAGASCGHPRTGDAG